MSSGREDGWQISYCGNAYFYIPILYKKNVFQLFQDYVRENEEDGEEKDQQE
jgi:hypothetical protein